VEETESFKPFIKVSFDAKKWGKEEGNIKRTKKEWYKEIM
jgi:hypothetical protein